MLLLGSEIPAGPLTVFQDHLSPETFHFLPGSPRLVGGAAGPGLYLLRYRGGHEGGLLGADVDLSLDASALDAAREVLVSRFGHDVNLVPVLFRSGTARLTVLGVEQGPPTDGAARPFLVERVLGAATPSLLGHARAVFAVELDREGASLIEAALRGNALPLLVVYELAFQGLRPARGMRAHVENRMSYDYLRTRFAASALVFKADLDREAEALERQGHIRIEDVDYQGADPVLREQRQVEMRATLRELAETLFFRPAGSPASLGERALAASGAVPAAWSGQGAPQAAFVLRGLEQREEQTLDYDLSVASVATARIAPQGSLEVPEGTDISKVVREVTFGEGPATLAIRAFSLPDADWSGVEAVQVDLRSGTETRSLVLRPDDTELRAELPPGEAQYRIRVLATPEPDALGSPPAPQEAFAKLEVSQLQIDPAVLSGRRVLRLTTGFFADPAAVRVRGRLRGGGAVREFLLDARRPELLVTVWGDAALTWDATVSIADEPPLILEGTVPPGETTLVFNLPSQTHPLVLATLQDPLERYESVFVEIEDAGGQHRRGFRLDAREPVARWSGARAPALGPAYRYRVRKVLRNARVVERDWTDGAGSLLMVGDTDLRVETIEAIVAKAADYLGGLLRFRSLDPPSDTPAEAEVVLDPGQARVTVRLPFRNKAPRRYRVEGELFLESGSRVIGPVEQSSEVFLLA